MQVLKRIWLVDAFVTLFLVKSPKTGMSQRMLVPSKFGNYFPETYYNNTFGTVGVVHETTDDPKLKVVEVTPYRKEGVV